MPKLNQLKKAAADQAKQVVADVKSVLDAPVDKAWYYTADAAKHAAADVRTEARKTIEHNIDKEYKKEVSKAKESLVEARENFKQSVADELGYTKNTLHDDILAFDAELENELVAQIETLDI